MNLVQMANPPYHKIYNVDNMQKGYVAISISIKNVPFLSNNIPASSAYGVFSSNAYTIFPGLLLVWMFYSEGDTTFK